VSEGRLPILAKIFPLEPVELGCVPVLLNVSVSILCPICSSHKFAKRIRGNVCSKFALLGWSPCALLLCSVLINEGFRGRSGASSGLAVGLGRWTRASGGLTARAGWLRHWRGGGRASSGLGSGRKEPSQAHEVIGGARAGDHPVDPRRPAVLQLTQPRHRLEPLEDLFELLAGSRGLIH
jgi:hypothetical protein